MRADLVALLGLSLVHAATASAESRAAGSSKPRVCALAVSGPEFLSTGAQHGIALGAGCETSSPTQNRFYAPPNASCTLVFDPKEWLADGWSFVGVDGQGQFRSYLSGETLRVEIQAKRGFRLSRMRVKALRSSCDSASIRIQDIVR